MFQERTYRTKITASDLVGFEVAVKETDLFILAEKELKEETTTAVLKYRNQLEKYITNDPEFQTALVPYPVSDFAPMMVKAMATAAQNANVGPMAAVAGAINDFVAKELLLKTEELIIENGGDIFIQTKKPRRLLVYAGDSPFSEKLAIAIEPEQTPCGVCTSSGTVGHSLSFGKADAVTILATTATLADAIATAVGNIIKEPKDINGGIELAQKIDGVQGILIIIQDKLGVWGTIKLT
jgi:hypothetical protein